MGFLAPRFYSQYYVVHALFVAAYALLRAFVLEGRLGLRESDSGSVIGSSRETEVTLLLLLFIAMRWARGGSLDAFLGHVVWISKAYILLMTWYTDRRAMGWFLVAFFVALTAVRQPRCEGPRRMPALSPETFEAFVASQPTTKGATAIVLFWSASVDASVAFVSVFETLAAKFGATGGVAFAAVDVEQHPALAVTHWVDPGASSLQVRLPPHAVPAPAAWP